jgi:hypothetical protein
MRELMAMPDMSWLDCRMPATYHKIGEFYVSNRHRAMRKPGRCATLTPEMRAEVLRSLRHSPNRSTALKSCGVPRQTFYRWLEADESFRESVVRSEGFARDVRTGVLDGFRAVMGEYLETGTGGTL